MPRFGRSPEDILRNIRAELSRLVRRTNSHDGGGSGGERRSAALRVFESLDRDGSGRLSRRDFRRALRELGFDRLGDDEEAAEILDHFDPGRNGRIRYKDFLRDIQEDEAYVPRERRPPTIGGTERGGSGRRGGGGGGATERERLEDTLVRAIGRGLDYRREMELEEGRAGGKVEEGIVSRQSFRAVMKLLKADFSAEELKSLERRFAAPPPPSGAKHASGASSMAHHRGGRSKTGGEAGVRFVELLHWGTPRRLSGEGNEEDWAIEERLRQMIRRRFNIWMPGALKKAFRHFDARRKGKVSENDMSDGLHRLGLELTTRQERTLFKAIDLDGAGFLVYPDLVVFARDPNHGDVRDKILRQMARATRSQLQEELERKDPSASGMISQQALAKALTKFGADFAGADLSRLMHRFDVHEDGTASIERVLSFVSGGIDRAAGARRGARERFDDQEPSGDDGDYSDEDDDDDDEDDDDDDALGDARRKLRSALKLGTAKEMSPQRLFEYLDPDGLGEVSDVDLCDGLDSLGVKLTRRESRLLTDFIADGGGGDGGGSHTRGSASRARRRLNFRQFSRVLDGSRSRSRPRLATSPTERGGGRRRSNPSTSQKGRSTSSNSLLLLETPTTTRGGSRSPAANRRRTKGVTFLEEQEGSGDDDGEAGGLWSHRAPETLRLSLRHLVSSTTDPADHRTAAASGGAVVAAGGEGGGGGGGAGNSVGPGLRDKLRGALQIAADARGARRGQRHVDLETVRRAMTACGAPLTSKLLSDLGRRFDRRGTGEVNVEEFVNFVAGVVEADVWERVSVDVADMQQGARRSSGRDGRGSGDKGGLVLVRAFMSDLSQFVDGRQEISRRDLRKALERQGVSTLREAEVLVLCDSIDPERRGRMRLSDVRRSLCRGMVAAGLCSEGEDESYGESSVDAAPETAATVLDELRLLVAAAESEGGVGLLESFEHFDRRGQGEVSEAEFWEGLQSLGLGRDLPRSHASRIVESFKGRRHGYVRYKDFVEAMEEPSYSRGGGRRKTGGIVEGTKGGGGGGGRRQGERSGARRRSSADDIERLVDTLKEEIGRLTEEEDGPPPFRQVFEAADRRGAGTLPSLAFRRCLLEGLGLRLTEPECEALLDYLDTGGDNNISYREFLQFVGHEVRERTPPRSRSPRRARPIVASAPDPYGNDASAAADSSTGGGERDSFVRSPPRQRRYSSPSREKPGARTSRRVKR